MVGAHLGWLGRSRGPREGGRGPLRAVGPHLGRGRGFDLRYELGSQLAKRIGVSRLSQKVDSPQAQGLQRVVRAALGERAHHDHRRRPALHEQLQECEAVHARHLQVEGKHIGLKLQQPIASHIGIFSRSDDLDLRIRCERLARIPADDGGVVDDEHADLSGCEHVQETGGRRYVAGFMS